MLAITDHSQTMVENGFAFDPKKTLPRDPKNSGGPPPICFPTVFPSNPFRSNGAISGVLLGRQLAAFCEFGHGTLGCGLRSLASSVAVHLLGSAWTTAGFPWENLEETGGLREIWNLAEKVHIFHSKKPRLRTTQALAPGICVQHQDVDVFLAGLGHSPMSTGDCSRIVYKLVKSLVLYWTCSCLKSQVWMVWEGFYDEDRGLSIIGRGNLNLWIVK